MIKCYKSSVKHLWTSKDPIITIQSLQYFCKLILFLREWCHVLHVFCMVFPHSLQMNTLSYRVVFCHMFFGYSVLSSTEQDRATPSFSMIGKRLVSSKKDQKMSDIILSKFNDFIFKIWKNMTSKQAFHMIGCKH